MSHSLLQRVWGKQLGHFKQALALAAIILASASLAQADVPDPTRDQPFADPVKEAEARSFMREIRCVVCQSQSIDESDAEIAAQLRNAIREQMAAGKSPDEIRDYLVARYGDFVLLDPPFKSATLLLWIGPFALAAIGVGFVLLQRRRKLAMAAGGIGLAPPELSESERARVQRLLVESEDEPPHSPSRGGVA
jgi:cytochrome c-type biogenesis protein CcmH